MTANPNTQPPAFGIWLKRLRAQHDLTQESLAELVACSVQTIRFFETGKRRPSLEMAERLADVLQVPGDQRERFIRQARSALSTTSEAEDSTTSTSPTDTPAASTPTAGDMAAAATQRLPAPATELIGRKAELNTLRHLLIDGSCRLVTVMGPGGMGKTRLALHAAHELAGHFQDGAAFVSLVSISQGADLPSVIAGALNTKLPGESSPAAQLDSLLGEMSLLLVLDNFEHLLAPDDEAVALVEHIVERLPEVRLLITSRERLRVAGEHILELEGLVTPRAPAGADSTLAVAQAAPGAIEESDSVILFLQRARQVHPGFSLTPANRAAIARICTLLDGMPLGIELAAAWVRALSVDEIAAEIAQGIDFLTLADRSAPARHRSLRAVFDHSWRLLPPEEQAVAARLAVFRDGFRREAAAAVAGARLPQLAALIDKSLVRMTTDLPTAPGGETTPDGLPDAGMIRYGIHELLRQFLHDQARARGEEQAANRRHAEYFTELAERIEPQLYGGRTVASLRQLESEQGNFRAAFEWSLTHANDPVLGLRLASALGRYWYLAGAWKEGREWLQLALERNSTDTGSTARARALGKLGELYHALSEYDQGRRCLEESLRLWQDHQQSDQVAWTLFQLGVLHSTLGENDQAKALMEESLALYRANDNGWYVAIVLRQLAGLLLENGDFARAGPLLDEAVSIFRQLKYDSGMGIVLNLLGWTRLEQGDAAGAIAHFTDAKTISHRYGNVPTVGWALRNLGYAYIRAGQFAQAEQSLRACLRIYRQLGFKSGSIIAFEILAALEAERDRPAQAVRWLAVAGCLRQATGQPRTPLEAGFYQRTLTLTQAALDETAWQAAWAEGATLSLEEAFAQAMTG